ncbi:MAG: leucyl/phenylalanyl-tRNA--protein transferase [Proteobacteria bacterium]|nr:leucyl/phenylalanyl-tRNA--protein transferase [Pseudomonadota bacterium]
MGETITPEDVLDAYCHGLFPMAENADDPDIFWVSPEMRGIIPLEGFHASRSLLKLAKKQPFKVTVNKAFDAVIDGCAATGKGRHVTWINQQIRDLYTALHRMGYAHSVECWGQDGVLAGGLYGIAINGAFFGESMFSTATNASKIALVHLVERLKKQGFVLLDCQFVNSHLLQFGCVEISRDDYRSRLSEALLLEGVSFAASSAMYSSIAASVAERVSSSDAASAGLDSVSDAALGSRQSSTVTS